MSVNSWVPCASIENLRKRAQIISSIREFFVSKNFLEVDTPILSKSGNTDPHIESLSTKVCTDSAVAEIFIYIPHLNSQ
jgi:elongation factor P--(R)-beta-lysine ligase